MSWGTQAVGKAKAVKASLAKQFETCKKNCAHIPSEVASIEAIEGLVNGQLDSLGDAGAVVSVTCGGSVSINNGHVTSLTTNYKLDTLYGFVE